MQKKIMPMLIACLMLIFSFSVSAETVTIQLGMLIENSAEYDGKVVTVKGEVLGEVMERGDYAWINITDTTNATGVWLKLKDTKSIAFFGDYKHKGDIVKITGVFHKACKDHNGELDLHSSEIEVAQRGCAVTEKPDMVKIYGIAVLLPAFVGMLCVFYFKMKK